MRDIIKVPNWITDECLISYSYIEKLLKSSDTDEIKMDFLRAVYVEDRLEFANIVNELTLRGFEFFPSRESTILPKKKYDYSKYISTSSNSNCYKNIDFVKIGIPNFQSLFRIESDLFFNYIPIEGFKYFNEMLDLDLLANEFKENGFNINRMNIISDISNLNDIDETTSKDECKEISIEELGFTVRAVNVLKSLGITNLTDLYYLECEKVIEVRNCGSKTLDEITSFVKCLKMYGPLRLEGVITSEMLSMSSIEHLNKMGIYYVRSLLVNSEVIDSYSEKVRLEINQLINCLGAIEQYKFNFETDDHENRDDEEIICIEELANLPVNILDLSVRSRNALELSGIETIGMLLDLGNDQIFKLKNIGAKSAVEIIDKVELFKQSSMYIEYSMNDNIRLNESNVFQYGHLPISRFITNLDDVDLNITNNYVVKDIGGLKVSELVDMGLKIETIETITRKFNNMVSINQMFNDYNFDPRSKEIIHYRFIEGYTLEELGTKFDLTRERVRQIIKKNILKLNNYLKHKNFEDVIKILSGKSIAIKATQISELAGESTVIVNMLMSDEAGVLSYFEPLDIFFFEENVLKTFLYDLSSYIDDLESVVLLYDELDNIFERLEKYNITDIDIVEVEILFNNYGYKKYGQYLVKSGMNNLLVLEIILRDYIKEPIYLNDDSYYILCKFAKDIFNFQISENTRSLEGCIRRIPSIMMCDKKTFIHINNLRFDERIIYMLDEYINKIIIEQEFIEKQQYYQYYIDINKSANKLSQYAIYSLLRYYLCDKYAFGRGNTLSIYRLDGIDKAELSNNVILERYLVSKNGKAHKSEIKRDLCWDEIKLTNTILNYNQFFYLGDGSIRLSNNSYFESMDKELVLSIILKKLESGYLSVSNLFLDFKFDVLLSQLLKKYEIDNENYLSSLLKINFEFLKGHSAILFHEDSPFSSLQEFIIHRYDRFERFELKELITSISTEPYYYSIMNSLMDLGAYIEIDDELFLKSEHVKIDEHVKLSVIDYIDDEIGNNMFIILKGLIGYRKKLPVIEYKWTPHLIRYCIEGNGYTALEKDYKDFRTDKMIMVKTGCGINKLDELVHWLLSNSYEGNLQEVKVAEYLCRLGILDFKDNSRYRIPAEIRSSQLFEFDSVGRITLR